MLNQIINTYNGTLINCAGLAIAATAGTILGKKFIPEQMQDYIMQALGLACIMLGICGTLDVSNPLYCIVSFVIGSIIGHVANLESNLENVLNRVAKAISGTSLSPRFIQGMIGYTLMSVTGSMAISGPIQNALEGRIDILQAKLILDITAGFLFAASYGVSVICSSLLVLAYQMTFGLLAVTLQPIMTGPVIGDMGAIGSVLILILGLNLTGSSKISTMNFTPCIFIPILLHHIFG